MAALHHPPRCDVFDPTRPFSGPLQFAYLEYASLFNAFLAPLVTTLLGTMQALATPAFFFIPMLHVLCLFSLPVLPLAWHYITFHYRRRLKAVEARTSKTTAFLDLAVACAQRATELTHTYQKQALDAASTTRRTTSLTLMLHSTDFDTSVSAWAATGHTTACVEELVTATSDVARLANNLQHLDAGGDDDDTEGGAEAQESVKRSQEAKGQAEHGRQEVRIEADSVEAKVAGIEKEAEGAREVLKQAMTVAVGGEMAAAEALVTNAETTLANVVQQVDDLSSVADEARRGWVEIAVDA
ncbi:hypothetical protein DXG01_013085 [Tephrocybe rancida]|nr:hypothetical protein DXG01_013085 [Tephrocybe rancida]